MSNPGRKSREDGPNYYTARLNNGDYRVVQAFGHADAKRFYTIGRTYDIRAESVRRVKAEHHKAAILHIGIIHPSDAAAMDTIRSIHERVGP